MSLENNQEVQPQEETTIDKNLSQLVNNAVTSHLKRQPKTDYDAIADKVIAKLNLSHSQEPTTPVDPNDSLRKELDAFKRKFSESERVASEERFLGALKNELLSSGKVKPKAIPHIADLFKAREMVDLKSQSLRIGDESLTLSEGVARFLESDDASFYLEAPATQPKQLSRNVFAPPASKSATTVSNAPLSKEEQYRQKMAKYSKGQF